ncbi:Aspartate carbamoyltransferase 2, chloroplastic [Vitis vinifera]|uniref:Aspartate carbamoyltransferase 2, chloroplastic n=1 Tax=Vitis vinifera TaxID=29760 RepID=A0A438H5U5_VITVI|nr:Aspartate carbamoyltransferase 2, chloroplastic [Vitis vinifera]
MHGNSPSAAKGETLEDTIRTVEGYSDIIVMRHFESGAARRAAVTAEIPIINAGDGPGQHPTQRDREDWIESKSGLLEILQMGRTVRSLAYLLAKYQDVKIYFVSPEVVKMKRERLEKGPDLYEEPRQVHCGSRCVRCDAEACCSHASPPKLDEITVDVDEDQRAAYFRQAKNGLYIRMLC